MNDSPSRRSKLAFFRSHSTIMDNFEKVMQNNREWAQAMVDDDPEYF
jgi:hypothetical protein